MTRKLSIFFLLLLVLLTDNSFAQNVPDLVVSANKRYLQTKDGKPFFWLGDTGWLLFTKLKREEAIQYLDDRKAKGFNVVQAMGLHTLSVVNMYGDSALVARQVAKPNTTPGTSFSNPQEYDFWDHVEFVIDEAAKRGIYIGFVPVWGGNVKEGKITPQQAETYATFLANRFGKKSNIIWLNGGDIRGSEALDVWNTIGNTINKLDDKHLITYHPRGRTSSSDWFHNESWLDFNMVQSGHRSYAQDTSANEERHFGEDNWKYIDVDYALKPTKPVIDGEPSYEGIPYGLHDVTQPRWTAADVRRYGYWSVLAGAFGYTYGQNAVMQMYRGNKNEENSYGPLELWNQGLNAAGASQMQYLKKLIESKKDYVNRQPSQNLVLDQGQRYDYIVASSGGKFALFYTYTGRNFKVKMGTTLGKEVKAYWYNPRNGSTTLIGKFKNTHSKEFNPPATPQAGNDWVLILESDL